MDSIVTSVFDNATTSAEWDLFVGTPVEGNSPLDSSGLTQGITAYNPATGEFVFESSNVATIRDGYREALARWSIKVTTLYPDFVPATDILELQWRPSAAIPAGSSTGWGIVLGITDGPAADFGTQVGAHVALVQGSATPGEYTAALLTSSSIGTSGSTETIADLDAITMVWMQWNNTAVVSSAYTKDNAGTWTEMNTSTLTTSPILAADEYHFQICLAHQQATVSAGEIWRGFLYTRKTTLDRGF